MTTTSHPPSSSVLTVPTTQNTAPVLSFNCLYTHDLRRKAKRWQDGFLRFHTFNKRVMVYDVLRNFIGDTHWRESQAIQDGEELELEKGVLIQVGEEAERTETDLTELLEKRKAKPVPSGERSSAQNAPGRTHFTSRNQPSDTIHRAVERLAPTQASQLRPKSLNALLGKHRGPVGRASLPTKSPADQRREKENHSIDGDARSPKRRRLNSPKDSTPSAPSTKASGMQPVLQSVKDARVPYTSSRTLQAVDSQVSVMTRETSPISERLGLAKGRQDVRLHSKAGSSGKHRSKQPIHETLDARPDIEDHAWPRERIQRSDAAVHAPSKPATHEYNCHVKPCEIPKTTLPRSDTASRNRRLPVKVVNAESGSRKTTLFDEPSPTNLLRIASAKPRKKLIYRDLLPQKAPPPVHQSRSSKEVSSRSSRPATSATKDANKRREPLLDDFHEAQRGRLHDRLSKCNITSNAAFKETTFLEDEEVDNNLGTGNEASSPKGNDASNLPESLFLTQVSSDECMTNAGNSPTNAVDALENHAVSETAPDADIESSSSSQPQLAPGDLDIAPSNAAHTKQQAPAAERNETFNAPSSRQEANAQDEPVPSTPARGIHTGLVSNSPHAQDTEQPFTSRPQNYPVDDPAPRNHAVIIKAALPPPQHRTSRPFQRSISDASAYAAPKPRENHGFTKPSCLRRHLSAETAKPIPLVQTTSVYALKNGKMGVGGPGRDRRVPMAREQVADPWSREAFDLFGFDGCDRRVGTEHGLEIAGQEGRAGGVMRGGVMRGGGGEGGGEGEGEGGMRHVLDDIMAESQGFV